MLPEKIPVVILCGGQGTRMRGATPSKKELVEIGGRPILWHVMKVYAAYGHTRFILALGHQAEEIKRYFLEYKSMNCDITIHLGQSGALSFQQPGTENWEITLANTGLSTEKGSRIYRIGQYIEADTFFVTYGDGVGDVELDALLAFHRRHGKLATVTGVRPRSQYGVIQVEETGQITSFGEKPLLDHWINAGFMLFERKVLDYLAGKDGVHQGNAHRDDVHLERETLPRLVADEQLMMYHHTGFWHSMDTFKDALRLDAIWRERAPWKIWE